MSDSELLAPLNGRHKMGFAMLSTLPYDPERHSLLSGAIPSKAAFMAALESRDFWFKEVSPQTGLYLANKSAHEEFCGIAQREVSALNYVLVFGVTHEPMPGTEMLFQDTLRPRLYNSDGRLVKRMNECYWSDQARAGELRIFIASLADAIRMELRAIIRRQEAQGH